MSLVKILLEGKNYATLYHFTSYGKLELILRQNRLKATQGSEGDKNVSLTRSHKLDGFGQCRISLDAQSLSDNYKIEPFLYQGKGYVGAEDPEFPRKRYGEEREERVPKTIRNIKRYIIQVDIKYHGTLSSQNKVKRIREQLARENPNVTINMVRHWQPVKKRV